VKEPRDTRTLANVASLAICGILAGVVVAAAAFPVVGVSGLSAKSASDSFNDLPAAIKIPAFPQKSVLYASDNKTALAIFYDQNRDPVPLTQVAPVMQEAMVAAEDNRFYEHRGVDARGIVRAFVHNQADGSVQQQGASTLTQQYVRAVLTQSAIAANDPELKRAATEDTAGRKLREIRYAIALEKQLSKKEILERYLNTVYFGQNAYGIRAASWSYFGKLPSALTLPEAAMIAGLAQNPNQYNPVTNGPKNALVRRTYVLSGMVKLGYIGSAEAKAAEKSLIVLNPKAQKQSCENGYAAYGFFCRFFYDWWLSNPAFGATSNERENNLRRGGYRIVASIDPRMQKGAQKAISDQVSDQNPFALGTVIVEPGTGRVKAMAINRRYGIKKNPGGKNYPYTTNPLLSGSDVSPGYQAGSTFKMFTMLAALKKGIPLSHTIFAQPKYKSQYVPGSCDGHYCPKNESKSMTGVQTMSSGFGESANTYFVPLEEEVSVKSAVAVAQAAGIDFRDTETIKNIKAAQTDPNTFGSFTLGVASVTPLDMATAYATVAAGGKHCDPLPVKSITDGDGRPVAAANPTCNQAFPRTVTDAATDAARCPVGDQSMVGISCTHPGGGVTGSRFGGAIDRPVAGKTGTTGDLGDTTSWFVGFAPNLAVASFLANPDSPHQEIPSSRWSLSAALGGFETALQGLPVKQFRAPTSLLARGIQVNVPDVVGDSVGGARGQLQNRGFNVRVESKPIDSTQPAGRVAKTDPSGGSTTSKGSIVTVYVSSGKPPAPTPAPGQPKPGQPPAQVCQTFPNLPNCPQPGG
jgi:membrane peptidoglycan carboxypeptidase